MVFNFNLISLNFRLNRLAFNDMKTQFYVSKDVQRYIGLLLRFKFYKFIEKYSKIRSLSLN